MTTLVIDAKAFDGRMIECTGDTYAEALAGLIAQAASIGRAVKVEARIYRAEDDDIVAVVSDAGEVFRGRPNMGAAYTPPADREPISGDDIPVPDEYANQTPMQGDRW